MSDAAYLHPSPRSANVSTPDDDGSMPFAASHDDLSLKTRERLAKAATRDWRSSLVSWWPVAVGLVLAAYAPQLRMICSSLGDWALRFFMPMVTMAYQFQGTSLRVVAHDLPQVALTVQFPLEGIFVRRTLRRGVSLTAVIVLMFLLHVVSTILLWMLLNRR